MIRALRLKFTALSMAALAVLLVVIVAGMNLLNYNTVIQEADDILSVLSQNRGSFPEFLDEKKGGMPKHMSPETPYESRFFSVLLNDDGNVIQTDTSRIKAVDPADALAYAASALQQGRSQGFVEEYRFVCTAEDDTLRLTFLDCGRKLHSFRTFLMASIAMAVVGFVVFSLVILFFSGKLLRPVAESYEKQKRFITDAGHEIKTPLTIISADVDVLELELEGENEWLSDIRRQAGRLSALTNDLVYLSRMEECAEPMPMIEFPFSDVVSETAASFQALAQTQEKDLRCDIQPMLTLNGSEKAIRQLVNILLDNALKYSPTGAAIRLSLMPQGRQMKLTVFNPTETPIPKDDLDVLFDRFYRLDASRSSQTGGYGIGLSVAKAIVTAHGGKIRASTQDGRSLQITAVFPQ